MSSRAPPPDPRKPKVAPMRPHHPPSRAIPPQGQRRLSQQSLSQQQQQQRLRQQQHLQRLQQQSYDDENYKCCFNSIPWGYRDRCVVSLCLLALFIMGMAAIVFEAIIPGVHKFSLEIKHFFHPPPGSELENNNGMWFGGESVTDGFQNVQSQNP